MNEDRWPLNKPPDLHQCKHTRTQNSQKDCKTEKSQIMDYSIFYTAAFFEIPYKQKSTKCDVHVLKMTLVTGLNPVTRPSARIFS